MGRQRVEWVRHHILSSDAIPIHHTHSKEAIDDKEAQRIAARVPAGTQALVKRFEGSALPHVDLMEAYSDVSACACASVGFNPQPLVYPHSYPHHSPAVAGRAAAARGRQDAARLGGEQVTSNKK